MGPNSRIKCLRWTHSLFGFAGSSLIFFLTGIQILQIASTTRSRRGNKSQKSPFWFASKRSYSQNSDSPTWRRGIAELRSSHKPIQNKHWSRSRWFGSSQWIKSICNRVIILSVLFCDQSQIPRVYQPNTCTNTPYICLDFVTGQLATKATPSRQLSANTGKTQATSASPCSSIQHGQTWTKIRHKD